jgi:D-cysteine desulfhydrase family pyridoxal phosphate-dependent enzyme
VSLVNLPRVSLGVFPTPLQELVNLSKTLGGPHILIKREDLSGLGAGGNKVRHLEFVLADVKRSGADTVIGTYSTQSNYCLQLAAAAHKLNMNAGFILFEGQHPEMQGNLLLQKILNSRVKILKGSRLTGDYAANVDKEMDKMAQEYIKMGRRPVIIKYGSDPYYDNFAVIGWVDGAEELLHQLQVEKINAQYLVVSVGTAITAAGLILGLKLLKSPLKFVGISISKSREEITEQIIQKANAAANFMNWDISITPEDMIIYDGYVGEGYGVASQEGLETIKLVAQTEGFFLDPVYTGKGMAGLIDLIRKGRFTSEDTAVFLHTGGFPAIFAYVKEMINSAEADS